MYPSLIIWYSVVSYTVVSYPNLVVSNPSVNRFVPKPLIYSFPSLYTFIQNTSRASVSTDVDCCVVYFFLPLLLTVMNSFIPTKRNKKHKFLPMESRFCWNKYWKDAQTSTNPWSNEVKAITTCCDEVDTTLKQVILLFSIRNRPYFKHGKHSLLVWVRSDRAGYETIQLAGYETTGNHSFYYLLFYMRCNFTFNI